MTLVIGIGTENKVKTYRVAFVNFWPEFKPEAFFLPLLKESLGVDLMASPHHLADIVITSVFNLDRSRNLVGKTLAVKKNLLANLNSFSSTDRYLGFQMLSSQKLIWFTGENIRPPLIDFDLSISFDNDDEGLRNIYFPLGLMSLDWWGVPGYKDSPEFRRSGISVRPLQATRSRKTDIASRPKFACAFIGRPEPGRMRAIRTLEETTGQRVQVFGKQGTRTLKSKVEVASEYRFMLCFENDAYPGYVTEKAIEAWACGCIPIWDGLDEHKILNADALVNRREFDNLLEMSSRVLELDCNREELTEKASRPILSPNGLRQMHKLQTALANVLLEGE